MTKSTSFLLFLFLSLLITTSFSTQSSPATITTAQQAAIVLGIHSEYPNPEAFKIEFIDKKGALAFSHQGADYGWGMSATGKSIPSGTYQLLISWRNEQGKAKKTRQQIVIQPTTQLFSLNIELANDPTIGRVFNGIYLDQYTSSLSGVEFSRQWNPQQQWEKDSLLLPDYQITNNNDSTIYGAYTRASSQLTINWVHPHHIAFLRLEQKEGEQWKRLNCNAPRINLNLKKGEQGQTLKDMVLGCETTNFKKGTPYRVKINYLLDNRTLKENPAKRRWEANIYIEQTIYSFTDEFELK